MDKKFYETPDMDVLELAVKKTLLVGSPGEEGFNDDFSGGKNDDPDPGDW